ncbi:hypothetical protein A5745_22265 [Mycobacterium sp. IS-2888]|uniref:hypothetical protein n=1 Tax=Mycobacterium sp. IS-2888 TaxID=1834159 RepID=UPI00096D5687|nr:hypothetical protein [Mycobacterium sp. IS-2888]OMC53260.1 hypothetical protein A5745_22265 [Mycobacterium sp. IS-2888]
MSSDTAGAPGENKGEGNKDYPAEEIDLGDLPEGKRSGHAWFEQIKGIIGLIAGLAIIAVGVAMIFGKVDGSVDLEIGNKVHLQTAVVGVVVCLIGVAVIAFTRAIVKRGDGADKA